MSCPSELDQMLYVDGELSGAARSAFEAHLAACAACRQRVAALAGENEMLGEVLRAPEPAITTRGLVWAGLALAATAMCVHVGLDALAQLNAQLGWLSPLSGQSHIALLFDFTSFLAQEEVPMLFTVLAGLAATLLGFATFALFTRRRFVPAAIASLAMLLVAAPPSSATELRAPAHGKGDSVVIPAGETIDDTVFAAAREIVVEGTVTGDLIALGQQVRIPGEVRGSVLALARDVVIEGKIGGDLYSASQNLGVRGSVGRSVQAAGADIDVSSGARVGRDVLLACEGGRINGAVGRDFRAVGDVFRVGGEVTRAVHVSGHELHLGPTARIGGDVTANVQGANMFTRDAGAQLAQEPQIRIVSPKARHARGPNRWLRPMFYFWQLVRVAAAFALGLLLYWLVPALFERTAPTARRLLISAGVGFLALVAAPVAAVLLAMTLVGLPTGILGLILWIVGLYLSGVYVALVIGHALLRSPHAHGRSFALALLIGLVVLRIAVNLPFLGGLLCFLAVITGLGLMVAQLGRIVGRLRTPEAAA